MNRPTKAALFSALLYPGSGHIFLKKPAVGTLLICIFTVPLYFVVIEIFTKAQGIAEQIINGEIPLDVTAISESITQSIYGADSQELNIKLYALIIVWLIGIVDSYRLGRIKN
jgi:hypothetical protein